MYHAAANPGDDADHVPPRGSQEPGSYFLYNNWDFNAAGTAFEMATGQDIYAAFARDIAAPLHMEDFQLSSQHKHPNASRSVHPAYHFLLSTRDMSRLGQLMLQQGRWDGQQLIPQDWVDAMLRPVTPAAQMHPPRTAERAWTTGCSGGCWTSRLPRRWLAPTWRGATTASSFSWCPDAGWSSPTSGT